MIDIMNNLFHDANHYRCQGGSVVRMKVTKEKATENRTAILAAARRLFRERGFDGVGLVEITKAAGLTHGGFYGHFASKDALIAEVCEQSFARSSERLLKRRVNRNEGLAEYLDFYLSEQHRDQTESGCPMPAHAGDIRHQDEAAQAKFSAGLDHFIDELSLFLQSADQEPERRRKAITLLATLVGAVSLARAARVTAPELSTEILASVRQQVARLTIADTPLGGSVQ